MGREDDIVVIGNLGGHMDKIVRRLIRAASAKSFFLQRYSSDPNPMKYVFAKLKHLRRKAESWTEGHQLLGHPSLPPSAPTSSKSRIWANLNASRFKVLA
jgi:transposase